MQDILSMIKVSCFLNLRKCHLTNNPPAHHELDGTSDAAWLEVEVVEPVAADMGMEVSFSCITITITITIS